MKTHTIEFSTTATLLLASISLLLTGCQCCKESSDAKSSSAAPAKVAATPKPTLPTIRIKTGVTAALKDSSGNEWLADQGFADGETIERPDLQIENTKDAAIYRAERYSMTKFTQALPNGKYVVKLHFAETYDGITGPGQRVFSFNVEGHEFKDFDVWTKSGGYLHAYVETVPVDITDAKLDITFTPNVENPEINGIEILPAPLSRLGNVKNSFLGHLLCLCLGSVCVVAEKSPAALPRSTPEAQGISSAAILDFVAAADKQVDAMHSFMLVRHGNVVAEGWWSPYSATTPHSMYSLSKSFTSTAVGLAISEGKLSLDDTVLNFFPEEAPAAPSANLKELRVRDLLRMNTGQHADDMAKFSFESSEPLVKLFLSMPVAHKPGTHFWYNTPATFMCSAIVQKVTGQTVFDYLKPRLFDPLGIENPTWEMKQQYTFGGSGLHIRTEDIARFGQLYLQRGQWHGQQLVPAAWIDAATSRQTANGSNPASDWDCGYGYQFWRCRPGCYRGDGAFGQFCIVIPEKDAIIAITSGTRNMQGVMNLVWEKLLPAMQPKRLRADKESGKELTQRLAHLTMRPLAGDAVPTAAAQWAGTTFNFPTNDQKIEAAGLQLDSLGKNVLLITRCNGVAQRTACGSGTWMKGRMTYAGLEEQPVAVSGAWTADGTYTAKLCFYETPFCLTVSLRFADGQLFYDCEYNVSFGPTKQPQLVGKPQ